jgi:hypothetical protein
MDNSSNANYGLIYLPVDELSIDIPTRIQQIFDCRHNATNDLEKKTNSSIATAFTLDELSEYFNEFIGGIGQPKTVVELLLGHTILSNGLYTRK